MSTKILLVDDDEDDVLFFSDALREVQPNARLEHAADGQMALELLTKGTFSPDVIFLDLNMPAANGWDCLREIKAIAKWKHVPVILYSTADLYTSGFTPADVGAIAFYRKSHSFDELKKNLGELLGLVSL
jgi:CheY-like chemotaxis protein